MTWAEAEWWHEKVAALIADGLDEDVAENRVLSWYYQHHTRLHNLAYGDCQFPLHLVAPSVKREPPDEKTHLSGRDAVTPQSSKISEIFRP